VTVSDNCTGEITISSDAPTSFPVGATVVTYVATVAAGNMTRCTQTVTVFDTTPPTLTCPLALTVEPNAGCTWVGDFGQATATDADSDDALILITNDAPGAFPLGTTPVTWTATDPAGNSSTCTQEITVVDTTPPTITCPGENIATTCTDAGGTVVEFTASAVDNATVVCEPPSGATFPPGLTTITCTATDASGNTATCSFQVEGECGGLVRPGDCDGNGEIALPEPSCHEPASGSMIRSMVGLSKEKKRPYATAKSYI
jgi:hypothetical protein